MVQNVSRLVAANHLKCIVNLYIKKQQKKWVEILKNWGKH